MGKKNNLRPSSSKKQNNRSTHPHNNIKRTIVKRRNIKNKSHEHWKFKSSKVSTRVLRKQEKQEKEEQKKKTQIQRDEEEIKLIENEKNLFDPSGYYDPKESQEDLIINWEGDDNEEQGKKENEILSKMTNAVEKKLDDKVELAYKKAGEILSEYSSGKLPKIIGILPACEDWQLLINLTSPNNWTPMAMYELTVIFSSNLGPATANIFYENYLLPAIRKDIKKNKKLNIHYYESLKKSLFKPAAFFKGIILPLSRNLSGKEAAIIGSILKKCSIPVNHSSAALIQLINECKKGKNGMSVGALYFMRILLLKKYAMPQMVKEKFVEFIKSYSGYKLHIPVMFYQLFLIFVQIYKNDLTVKEIEELKMFNKNIAHHLISAEIGKELNFAAVKNKMDIV